MLFNAYVVLIVIAMVAFYFTSKPAWGGSHGRHLALRRRPLDVDGIHRAVWAAPAEKTWLQLNSLANLGISQRGINAFISMGFAFFAVVCMAVGFAQGSRQNRAIREKVLTEDVLSDDRLVTV